MVATFCDPARVGAFAADPKALTRGEPGTLARLLIATTMFQRLRDVLVLKILRSLSTEQVRELTELPALAAAAEQAPCPHGRSVEALRTSCDLTKQAGLGVCSAGAEHPCRLREHTVWLKRYGHFGKMPRSAALNLVEQGVSDLRELYERTVRESATPRAASERLIQELSRAWRFSDKLAHMFLSMLANPDLHEQGKAPWQQGLDWRYFIVIDSNVDLFLRATGYPGPWTYAARRDFLEALAERVELPAPLHSPNPRLVQQALFVFMGESNRKASGIDCAEQAPESCLSCRGELRMLCRLHD